MYIYVLLQEASYKTCAYIKQQKINIIHWQTLIS